MPALLGLIEPESSIISKLFEEGGSEGGEGGEEGLEGVEIEGRLWRGNGEIISRKMQSLKLKSVQLQYDKHFTAQFKSG